MFRLVVYMEAQQKTSSQVWGYRQEVGNPQIAGLTLLHFLGAHPQEGLLHLPNRRDGPLASLRSCSARTAQSLPPSLQSSNFANALHTCGLFHGLYGQFPSFVILLCQHIASWPAHISCPRWAKLKPFSFPLKFIHSISSTTSPTFVLLSLTQVQDPAVLIPISLFVSCNFHTLLEYWGAGYSIRACWNNLRMWRITAVTAWLFGFLSVILKLLGLSETVFEVTKKDQSTTPGEGSDKDSGRFTFDGSLIFVPATTLLLVHLMALVTALLGLFDLVGIESRIGEIICSVWVVLCFSPFLKGLFGKGKYGIPKSTICKSAALAFLFLACTITVRKWH